MAGSTGGRVANGLPNDARMKTLKHEHWASRETFVDVFHDETSQVVKKVEQNGYARRLHGVVAPVRLSWGSTTNRSYKRLRPGIARASSARNLSMRSPTTTLPSLESASFDLAG